MSDATERVWELYTLKQSLEDQIQDIDGMLREALREVYEDEGVRKLPNGFTIKRSVSRDISIRAFKEKYPQIYDAAVKAKVESYKPELTKTDVKKAIASECEGMIRTKEEQERILADIETGGETVRFSLTKPADPHNPTGVVE